MSIFCGLKNSESAKSIPTGIDHVDDSIRVAGWVNAIVLVIAHCNDHSSADKRERMVVEAENWSFAVTSPIPETSKCWRFR